MKQEPVIFFKHENLLQAGICYLEFWDLQVVHAYTI